LLPLPHPVTIPGMELILTHEHSDFDALAAQLGAHKLIPSAVPVLSNNLHRNVRHFLGLYQDELPFVDARHLPRETVTRVVLVDTQTLPSARGINEQTAVTVIDHHPVREDLDPSWNLTSEQVGATTTLLVEDIRDRGLTLTPLEATLLALGIHEDTGSLTYGTTTARDAYATAWLLKQGALLDVISRFLHHPLAPDQKELYERLIESAEAVNIEGYTVVIATANAPDLVEEVATLAHKVRDLLEPSALFLLVDLGTHIQLVARSSVDAIDVGAIARRFEGGGHGRAAAAILRGATLESARAALIDALEAAVRPGVTVADLMSVGVQTLAPTARARDADRKMRRYGYEGFPVVRAGHVVGLVTRRAIDRALDHGLDGVRVEQLMVAGEVTVQPTDSIATLQRRMMNSGWGQVPVVDEAGQIIGVVTRTDLIKHLGHSAPSGSRRDAIERLLTAALPPALLALTREVGARAAALDFHVYVVGGFVRDLLLGRPNLDIDFVIEGDAITLARHLCAAFGGETRHHERFGTGKWLLNRDTWQVVAEHLGVTLNGTDLLPAHIDFATARTEFYDAPSVLPEVERGSIKHDLHRRDFTINTLALRIDPPFFGQVLDFYNGEDDLRAGVVRVLHSLSFVDDPTRILRAVRFEQRFGFRIDPRTEELIVNALPLIERLSGDRIRHEFEMLLAEPAPERAFQRLERLGVLQAIHPSLSFDSWTDAAFLALRYALGLPLWAGLDENFDPAVSYFALLLYRLTRDEMLAVGSRLRVRRRTLDALERIVAIRAALPRLSDPDLPPSEVAALLNHTDDRALLAAWAAAPDAIARSNILAFASRLRNVRPGISGEDLIARGLKPGPAFKRILTDLRHAWLNGEIASPEDEEALLEQLIAHHKER